MIITIKAMVFNAIASNLEVIGVVERDEREDSKYKVKKGGRHKWNGYSSSDAEIDLSALTKKETQKLAEVLETAGVHGCKIAAADVRKYLRASEGGVQSVRARTCRQAAWMLEHYFANLPHHTIFSKDEYGGNSHSGYWVSDVDWEPEKKGGRNDYREPEKTIFTIYHVENDIRQCDRITLYKADCQEMTCQEILAAQGFVPETLALMEKLRTETERYYTIREMVGQQYNACGLGVRDLDNALKKESGEREWGRARKLKLDRFGSDTRVVIDVLQEKEDAKEERYGKSGTIDPYRWHNWNMRFHTPSEEELVRHLDADEDTAEPVDVDVPVHPLIPCFDLSRHERMRIHVNNLTKYKYDADMGRRLILPERDWKMVNLLVDQSANKFEDIVSGKGRSMNVLSVGCPGTGKTATAEVFAEYKKRPLYSVQCSDLGMDADNVEHNLSVVMARASRWNAILLLDEADVYIRRRGIDLNQNAIVGAFLRVLEYSDCILFMTTNLEDSVDDAITSRCIARLHYGPPSPEDQAKIWRILVDLNKLKMSDNEIAKVTKAYPKLTGRDVKNIAKLASFIGEKGGEITYDTVVEAIMFKPTETYK